MSLWRRPAFLLTTTIGAAVAFAVSHFTDLSLQVAWQATLLSSLMGVLLALLESQTRWQAELHHDLLHSLGAPLGLLADSEFGARLLQLTDIFRQLASQDDALVREFSLLKLTAILDELGTIADGELVFFHTESWRQVYDELLLCGELDHYRSVCWIRTPHYWQDIPGRHSMHTNYRAAQCGIRIERIAILAEDIWPERAVAPHDPVISWLHDQHRHGISLTLVRERDLRGERKLLTDFGIYGERAVGTHDVDSDGRTLRFALEFSTAAVTLAEERWQRLQMFAISYQQLLDQRFRSA